MKRIAVILMFLLLLNFINSGAISARLDVVGDAGGGGGTASLPIDLRILSTISTVNNAFNTGCVLDMQLVGNTIYTGNEHGDPVFDVSNPRAPVKIFEIKRYFGDHSVRGPRSGIKVVDNKFYGAGFYLEVLELPSFRFLGGADQGGGYGDNVVGLDVLDNKAYIVSSFIFGQPNEQFGSFFILDVSDPQNITRSSVVKLGSVVGQPTTHPHKVIVTNNSANTEKIAYVGLKEGLWIFDVTDDANPVPTTELFVSQLVTDSGNDMDMQKDNNRLFLGNNGRGILIFDINPAYPQYLSLRSIIGPQYIALGDNIAFKAAGNKIFVASRSDRKLKVIDISNIDYPRVLATADINNTISPESWMPVGLEVGVDTQRKLVFVGGNQALNIYDASDFMP